MSNWVITIDTVGRSRDGTPPKKPPEPKTKTKIIEVSTNTKSFQRDLRVIKCFDKHLNAFLLLQLFGNKREESQRAIRKKCAEESGLRTPAVRRKQQERTVLFIFFWYSFSFSCFFLLFACMTWGSSAAGVDAGKSMSQKAAKIKLRAKKCKKSWMTIQKGFWGKGDLLRRGD